MYCVLFYYLLLFQYVRQKHPHAEDDLKVDVMLKSRCDVEFDIQKYQDVTPQGWEIVPRVEPLKVMNIFIDIL